jgi:cell wall-associated protease
MWTHSAGVGIDIPTLGTNLVNYNPFDISSIGHGTHVSGLIAAIANNSQGGIGVMPFRARIMGIKVFQGSGSDISTSSTFFYNAIRFAFQNGASVINVSLDAVTNGPAADSMAQSAFEQAVSAGTVVAVALGNAESGVNGAEIDKVHLTSVPAIYSNIQGVIGVGAYETATGNKSYFSHYSTKYGEIAAPGSVSGTTGLYSTIPTSLGSYGRLAGTSQAAPLVTAAAAITIGLIRNAYDVAPTPAEVENLILDGSDKTSALAPYFKDGNRLNLQTLVSHIQSVYPRTRTPASPVAIDPPTSEGCP